ncbi:MAG: UDP-glucose/GDP-mannose dehydrogenase family protein [Lautropia sp.]
MKVCVIGSGYVGLVTAACLADVGHDLVCVDLDPRKIDMLNRGEVPIHEPGLDALIAGNARAGRMRFTTRLEDTVDGTAGGGWYPDIFMIAVGTPPDEDGSADVGHVLAAARSIAQLVDRDTIVVVKSTVPVGTCDLVEATIAETLAARGAACRAPVASNPEFLKEGAAIGDFMTPDRIVVGSSDAGVVDVLKQLYAPLQRNRERMVVMSRRSSELTKYAANAMLATRISFMNELSGLAERLGADIEDVRHGIGSDPRIGTAFLYPGAGYGGSCFPKDVSALIVLARKLGMPLALVNAVQDVNDRQKLRLLQKVRDRMGDLRGRRIALWGLAFKPGTDDMREAPSRVLMEGLWAEGATVCAYDPQAMASCRAIYGDRPDLILAPTARAALEGADALVIVTEWKEFRSPDTQAMRTALACKLVFDGRNLYDPEQMRKAGIEYVSFGRPS